LAQALERSAQWEDLSRNRLEGWSAAFFCYGGTSSRNPRFCGSEGRREQMARYSKSASGDVKGAMERRKAGTLKTGKSGKTVKSKKQAIAIGLSEARAKGKKVPSKKSA
jgi:hypothetical protein